MNSLAAQTRLMHGGSSPTIPKAGFRPDINGLRAWAVVAVILYHFIVPGFTGGFVGVDVFFVISGFLMTGIIVRGLERDGTRWSILSFYLARARRIVPALAVLCAALLLIGRCVLLPIDYKMLATHVVFALGFISNFKFWKEAGYFDTASHEKWLLHTWSLAVEWQFYILLPILLILIWRLWPSRGALLTVIVTIMLASMSAAILLGSHDSVAAFYLLPTRAWELLAGGLIGLLVRAPETIRHRRNLIEVAGLALILLAVFTFDVTSPWPGWRALVPVTGAMLVLYAARENSNWTGNAIAQWLGNRSYSIYLWHWPLAVTLSYLDRTGEPASICAAIVLTLILSDLSYRWVEQPARCEWRSWPPRRAMIAFALVLSAISATSIAVRALDGFPQRVNPKVQAAIAESHNINPSGDGCFATQGNQSPSCIYGGKKVHAILIGDSHSNAVVTALAEAAHPEGYGVLALSYVSCPVLFGVQFTPIYYRAGLSGRDERCGDFLQWVALKLVDYASDIPAVLVYRASVYAFGHNEPSRPTAGKPLVYFTNVYEEPSQLFLDEFRQNLITSACKIARHRTVYLVRPIPEFGVDIPRATARAIMFGNPHRVSIALTEYHQRNSFIWSAQDEARARCGVKILDPLPYLCTNGSCQGTKGDRPLYLDDNHLSEYGNKLLVPMFAEIFVPSRHRTDTKE